MGITHTDSKIAPSMPTFPLGVTPKPPINPAQRSLQEQTQIRQNIHKANTNIVPTESEHKHKP